MNLDDDGDPLRWCPSCRAIYRADFPRCPMDGDILTVSDADPMIGTTIGQHYVIDDFLGEGAMARVYRAHHALLQHKQFAIKVMLGDLAATLEMRLRFAHEADAASKLAHPNVVSVVDFGRSESGLMFLVMELVTGRTLAEMIAREGRLKPRRALAITRQLCSGLAHAHERGLVHRDLKPENIVIAGRPEMVRIVDFGLAIVADDERSTRLTGVGLAMGTPIYAAPEQTHAEPIDHRADLFALGVTLYEMLAGAPPHEGGIIEVVRNNASDVMPPFADRGVKVPKAIEDLCRRLMRRDPADRFFDAAAVLAALDAAQPTISRVAFPAVPRPSRRGASVVLGVALLAGLATAGGFVAQPPDAPIAGAPVAEPPPPSEIIAEPAEPPPSVIIEEPALAAEPMHDPMSIDVATSMARFAGAPIGGVRPLPAPAVDEPPRVKSKTKRRRGATHLRPVADEAFHGGPKGFINLPDPVRTRRR